MRFSLFLLLFLSTLSLFSQKNSPAGYWTVTLVTVGENTMTPVSKWFHLGTDGDLQGGNGGNINLLGTWQILDDGGLLFTTAAGIEDPAGPFAMKLEGEQMTLERMEEGQLVQVSLTTYDPANWPTAPWDKVSGLWALDADKSTIITKAYGFQTAFFRWDNLVLFNWQQQDGSNWSALWRINAHRPTLEIAPNEECASRESWQISFSDNEMRWTRDIEEKQEVLVWKKQDN